MINEHLKDARMALDMNRVDFASKTGISVSQLEKVEGGKREFSDDLRKKLEKFANTLPAGNMQQVFDGLTRGEVVPIIGYKRKEAAKTTKKEEASNVVQFGYLIEQLTNKIDMLAKTVEENDVNEIVAGIKISLVSVHEQLDALKTPNSHSNVWRELRNLRDTCNLLAVQLNETQARLNRAKISMPEPGVEFITQQEGPKKVVEAFCSRSILSGPCLGMEV